MSTPHTLAAITKATYRDEMQLERAATAARFYRALADAIEADPRLAPGLSATEATASAYFYAKYGEERDFLAAARQLGEVQIAPPYMVVDVDLAGVIARFHIDTYNLPKRTVTKTVEVEEYVLDEDAL